jgi:hypothetical protein
MKVKVNLLPWGEVLQKPVTIEQECGVGRQTLQWLGYAACSEISNGRYFIKRCFALANL